jgi:UDP-N-acetylglucosamine transferase subunit ALG13
MIFVTLGNQNFKFNRLLESIELLVKTGVIDEEVIVQNGYTEFKTDSMKLIKFLDKEEFLGHIAKAKFIVSHAGTGSIISCLKLGKKVIVAPRLKSFGEHIDNHQLEIANVFGKKNFIIGLKKDFSDLEEKILSLPNVKLDFFNSNSQNFNENLIKIIDNF